jgi:hypothetical protein
VTFPWDPVMSTDSSAGADPNVEVKFTDDGDTDS